MGSRFVVQAAEQPAHPKSAPRRRPGISSHRCTQIGEQPGPFNAELEQLWQTHERLKTPLESNTDLTDGLTQAQVAARQAQAALNERLEAHRRALLNLLTEAAIAAFEELRTVWADLIAQGPVSEETMDRHAAKLRDAAAAGHELTAEEVALVEAAADAAETTAKLDVTLAALAGQLGGAAGQAMNLAVSMLQTNDNLNEGERDSRAFRWEPPWRPPPSTRWATPLAGRPERLCRP